MVPAVLVYTICVVYSAVRYIVFAPANIEHLPLFVMNKGISMAAAICFSLAFLVQWRGGNGAIWFRSGIFGVFAHIPMSLVILSPAYFPEFFGEGRLSFNGEAVFMFGAFATGGVYLVTRNHWSLLHRWWLSLATMLVLFGHILAMGMARGLNINRSHAYLPPMWLLSLICVALGVAFLLMSRPRHGASESR